MASASDIAPSVDKAYYLRWLALVIDGGTLVLRDQLDQRIPPNTLARELNKVVNRSKLQILIKKGVITKQQDQLLYPPDGKPSTSTFDVSLLTCLLRNLPVCGLSKNPSDWKDKRLQTDISVEADIVRLRLIRNELSHQTSTQMTAQEFLIKWKDVVQVLFRLGFNIPDLKENIEALELNSIDPKKEEEYKEELRQWEETDKCLQAEMEEMKTKLQETDTVVQGLSDKVTSLDTALSDINDDLQVELNELDELKDTVERHEDVLANNASNCELNHTALQQLEKKSESQDSHIDIIYKRVEVTETQQDQLKEDTAINLCAIQGDVESIETRLSTSQVEIKKNFKQIKTKHSQLESDIVKVKKKTDENMSSELRSLASFSELYFKDALSNSVYVETQAYNLAKEYLLKFKVIVITGHPGEGKTAMAIKLVSEVSSPENSLKLRDPSDWKHIDFKLKHFNCILIDDIFGEGVMDEDLVNIWKKHLKNVYCVTSSVMIIITSRHYIFEEARQLVGTSHVFLYRKVHVSSGSLSKTERTHILRKHLAINGREMTEEQVDSCVEISEIFLELFSVPDRTFLFGFPECVNMFVSNDELFQKGSAFFENPTAFFKRCIEDIALKEDKFLALVVLWSRKKKVLPISELDLSSTSHEVQRTVKMFGLKPKPRLIKVLRKSLEHHKGGFLNYDPNDGVYFFSHSIIDDMVGLVLSKDYPKETLDLCSRDFIIEYVTLDQAKHDEFHFFLERPMYDVIHCKIVKWLFWRRVFRQSEDSIKFNFGHSPYVRLKFFEIDKCILSLDAFTSASYVQAFIQFLIREDIVEDVVDQLILRMSGYFLSYGICIPDISIKVPSYFILNGNSVFFIELIRNKRTIKLVSENTMTVSLLLATHSELHDVVDCLLSIGCQVNEDAIYIAAQKENTNILSLLLQKRNPDIEQKSHVVNGNNALIMSAKKGFTKSVKCLIDHGVDLNYRNKDHMSALDKAVAYKHEDICKLLIENGASVNIRAGKFKRTPLLVASDQGLTQTVGLLLQRGASVNVKDTRGNYAIHCAVFRYRVGVVKTLIQHDIAQCNLRVMSHGPKSAIKGMTVFHIAAHKRYFELFEILIEQGLDPNTTDTYGRTPFYHAAYQGDCSLVNKMLSICDVNKAEKQGLTPLHAAVHKNRQAIVKLLCPHVNVNACDKFGKTPLHIACEKADTSIALFLVENAQADIYMATKKGETVFTLLDKNANNTKINVCISKRNDETSYRFNYRKTTHERNLKTFLELRKVLERMRRDRDESVTPRDYVASTSAAHSDVD